MAVRTLATLAALAVATPLRAADPETVDVFVADAGGYKLHRIPGVVVTAEGTVLAYCEARKSDRGDWGTVDILLRRSTDGVSWSAPAEITAGPFDPFKKGYDWKVLATGPGHGVRLKSGRLVVPVWLSLGTGGHAHRPSVVSTVFSDDGGKTWAAKRTVEPGTSACSDLAVATDGTVLFFYERGGPNRASYGRLTLARFGVDWVRGQ